MGQEGPPHVPLLDQPVFLMYLLHKHLRSRRPSAAAAPEAAFAGAISDFFFFFFLVMAKRAVSGAESKALLGTSQRPCLEIDASSNF